MSLGAAVSMLRDIGVTSVPVGIQVPPTGTVLTPERAIYDAHARGIYRFLRDMLGSDADAADAAQETFMRAFRQLSELRDESRLKAWLFGIARNVCLEQLRSLKRHRVVSATPRARVDLEQLTPEAMLLGREAASVIRQALEGMSTNRRTAFLLRVDHGLGYPDIAEALGWSLSKAKVEVHRARLRLRALLVEHAGGSP